MKHILLPSETVQATPLTADPSSGVQLVWGVNPDPSKIIPPSGPSPSSNTIAAFAWHPTGATLIGVSVLLGGVENDETHRPVDATISIGVGESGYMPTFVGRPGGGLMEMVPFSTWFEVARIPVERTIVPALDMVMFAISAPAHLIWLFGGILFEFEPLT